MGGSNPHRGGFTPPVGKKTPSLCFRWAWLCDTALGWRNPAHVATARPSGRRNPAHEGYGPAQGQGAASPSPEAGFRGFSRPGSTGLFLIESRGGGLSPAGRVFRKWIVIPCFKFLLELNIANIKKKKMSKAIAHFKRKVQHLKTTSRKFIKPYQDASIYWEIGTIYCSNWIHNFQFQKSYDQLIIPKTIEGR